MPATIAFRSSTPTGKLLGHLGRAGQRPGELSYPYGLVLDGAGPRLRLRVRQPSRAEVHARRPIAGLLGARTAARPAKLLNPWALVRDSQGGSTCSIRATIACNASNCEARLDLGQCNRMYHDRLRQPLVPAAAGGAAGCVVGQLSAAWRAWGGCGGWWRSRLRSAGLRAAGAGAGRSRSGCAPATG